MISPQPILHVITDKATPSQTRDMASFYEGHIKVAVDIERGILAGGGEWHVEAERLLLRQGSRQEDVWGAGYKPETQEVDFFSQINVRPRQDNPTREILSAEIRERVAKIVHDRLDP